MKKVLIPIVILLVILFSGCTTPIFLQNRIQLEDNVTISNLSLDSTIITTQYTINTDPSEGYEELYLYFGLNNRSGKNIIINFDEFLLIKNNQPFLPKACSLPWIVEFGPSQSLEVLIVYYFPIEQIPDTIEFSSFEKISIP